VVKKGGLAVRSSAVENYKFLTINKVSTALDQTD